MNNTGRIKVAPKLFDNGNLDGLQLHLKTEEILTKAPQKYPILSQVCFHGGASQFSWCLSSAYENASVNVLLFKVPKDSELKKIFDELKFIADKMRNENLTSEYEEEWKYAAIVVDRFSYLIF